jgi:predicted nucleic acid-binding protein
VARPRGDVVVDTNVILKFFFREEDYDKADLLHALSVTGEVRIVVPEFLPLEFINILWLKARQDELTRREVEDVKGRFVKLVTTFEVVSSIHLIEQILTSSLRHDHPAYDMAFLALASSLEIPFITADQKLYRKALTASRLPILLRDLEE